MSKERNQIEVSNKRKIARGVKSIFKWFFITLLALLLIVGLLFHAAWKITTLLLILLLACTVLPKRFRKWFWLGFGGVMVILIIWVFLPADNEDWKPFTFDKELAILEAKHSIPDEENAARFYNTLLEEEKKYKEPPPNKKMAELLEKGKVEIPIEDINDWLKGPYSTFYPEFWEYELDELTRKKFWSSKDYPQIAKWLETHENTITTLIKASRENKCRFPIISNSADLTKSMTRLSSMRRWAYLLIRSANNDIGDDRIDQAIEKYIAVLQMARHQYQQPLIVEYLVGLAIEALATEKLNRFVITGKPEDEHLNLIEEALAKNKHDWSSNWAKLLECEKLIGKNTTCSFCFQINPRGKVRFNHDPTATIRAAYLGEIPSPTYWQKRLTKVGIILAWFVMPSTPEKLAGIVDKEYERFYAMADPEYDWSKEPKEVSITSLFSTSVRLNYNYLVKLMADMAEESFYRIHDLYVRTIAEQRGSRIIILLKRYKNKNGSWPKNLQDIPSAPAEILVDPINNGSFVYKLTDDGFMLYSKGKNNVDEDGKYSSTWPESKPDDWLIWPTDN